MSGEIVNRVANSGIITFNLEDYYHEGERVIYDIKDNLFQGLVLREKDFRTFVKEYDWSIYEGKNVAIICSVDAIVPTWAYMLLTSVLEPICNKVIFGSLEQLEQSLYLDAFQKIDWEVYENARVVVKGCGDIPLSENLYITITKKLQPVVSSLMFGEACSAVPVFKEK